MADGSTPLVRIASAPNSAIAELWKGLLDNVGIPALIRMAAPLTGYVTFAGPYDLLVLASDGEGARQLLAAFHDDARDLVGGEQDEHDVISGDDAIPADEPLS